MGILDSSSSSTTVNTHTTNVDRKIANQSGVAFGLDAGGSVTYTANTLDAGAIGSAIESAGVQVANALLTAKQMSESALFQASQADVTSKAVSNSALDLVRGTAAFNAEGYSKLLVSTSTAFNGLLALADKAITGSFKSAGEVQQTLVNAQDVAQSKGTLDNRTITILGVAAVAGVALISMRHKAS